MSAGGARTAASLLLLMVGGAQVASATDVGSVIVLPNEPYVIPVPDKVYEFPNYNAPSVLTQRNDNNRSGASHSPGINQRSCCRKLGELSVGDAVVTAQPLYADSALVENVRQPVLIVATSTNTVWAFPPLPGAAPFWRGPVQLGPAFAAKDGTMCKPGPIAAKGLVGIEGTPVIDIANNQVLVAFKDAKAVQHLAAIDLNHGHPRTVEVPIPEGGKAEWSMLHHNRASLLLTDGVVYVAFGALCEDQPVANHGSIVAFDARTLAHVGTFRVTEGSMDGGGIWQGSTGLSADTRGNLYFVTGNRRLLRGCLAGYDNSNPPNAASLSNSVVRLKTEKRTAAGRPPGRNERYSLKMTVEDSFTPYRRVLGDCVDLDLGSSGAMLIPASRYLLAAGKEGMAYVLDRSDLGGYENAGPPWDFEGVRHMFAKLHHNDIPDDPKRDRVRQKFQVGENSYDRNYPVADLMKWPHVHGTPVFARFGRNEAFMFVWPEKDRLKRYRWSGDRFDPVFALGDLKAPPHLDGANNGMPGGMLSVNIDPSGPSLGLVLASIKVCGVSGYPDCNKFQDRGALRAYDPFTMKEIWWNQGEEYLFAKFVPPTVAKGMIFLATSSGKVLVYGP